VDFDFSSGDIAANIKILYDGDDAGAGQFAGPDFGLRSVDNLDWADNGYIYLNEDRSTEPSSLFGGTSGEEASIWKLDPNSGQLTRIGEIDRSAVPAGQTDSSPTDLGNWESSGILDVSELFDQPGGSLFLFDVQAHSLTGGTITSENLVQGGQLAFLRAATVGTDADENLNGINISELMAGEGGNDTIYGSAGDDVLRGDRNSRSAQAGEAGGDDIIYGGAGNDRIGGKSGDDMLFGEEGNDQIWGDGGDDLLWGGLGNDTLTGDNQSGSVGDDIFVLALNEGKDTITDFVNDGLDDGIGEFDKIGLAGGLTYTDLTFNGNSIFASGQELAVLDGVNPASLGTDSFITVTV
jgi:Ca2+-binding RTX toxin-like protein